VLEFPAIFGGYAVQRKGGQNFADDRIGSDSQVERALRHANSIEGSAHGVGLGVVGGRRLCVWGGGHPGTEAGVGMRSN